MKCMILEDEHLALKQMETYIGRTPFLSLVVSISNALDAYEAYHEHQPDLLFVDINMPELNGMEFVKSLKNPCMIIFTTAYSEYALESYKVDAVDYLLKPVSYLDFLKAAEKAHNLYQLKNEAAEISVDNGQYLFVKSEYRLIRIKFSEIKYIEGMREYIRVHLDDGSSVMTLMSMKYMEERLSKDMFMRVHRSFIVNLDKITTIERQRILFDNKIVIPVGEQYKEAFNDYVNRNFIGT